ncbi:MAG: ABC transporter permease [Eubacteriales bacterium]|jgi:ribose transport system permease protein
MTKKTKILSFLLQYYQILMLALIIIFLSITTESFLTLDNLQSVVMQQVPLLLIISIGMTTAIITKGIDNSIGSTLALSSCVAASIIVKGQDILGIVVGLAIGCLVGFANGILIAKVHLQPFITTYTMDMVIKGLAQLFMGGGIIYGFSESFCELGSGYIGGVSYLMIIAAVIFAVYLFVLSKTTFGKSVYAIGKNETATTLCGINADKIKIIVYTINGFLAAVAGLLYISRLNAAESSIGDGYTMEMMAATLIGGTPFSGGEGGIGRTLIGVCIMMFISNGMNLNNISSNWQDAVYGIVIIISLFLGVAGRSITQKFKLNEA